MVVMELPQAFLELLQLMLAGVEVDLSAVGLLQLVVLAVVVLVDLVELQRYRGLLIQAVAVVDQEVELLLVQRETVAPA
jgi:hypothetical protein